MMLANINVMALATATGQTLFIIPYISHKSVPVVKMAYMDNEMPDVSFV